MGCFSDVEAGASWGEACPPPAGRNPLENLSSSIAGQLALAAVLPASRSRSTQVLQ